MSNEYIIVGGELYHWGVKGMRWGQRRAKAKKEYEADLNKRQKEINDYADELYKESKEYKWLKKHPKADPDDYVDTIKNVEDYDDPNMEMADKVRARATPLDKSYAKGQALVSSVIGGTFAAPIAMFVTSKATKQIKNGKARAAIILGSAVGSVAAMGLYGYAAGKREHKKAVKAEGIKTVRERMKESKKKK